MIKKLIFIVLAVGIVIFVIGIISGSKQPPSTSTETPGTTGAPPQDKGNEGNKLANAVSIKLTPLPADAAIIYRLDGYLYVANRDGSNRTQITFAQKDYEHQAVSYNRKYIAANDHVNGASGKVSRLWLYDLTNGTEARLLSDFTSVGEGGVTWGPDGFIYFSATQDGRPDHQYAYKVKYDGTGLKRLTNINSIDIGVSSDGQYVSFMTTVGQPGAGPYHTEIWVVGADGAGARAVYKDGGEFLKSSVHDPEISDGNKKVVFSKVNPDFKNFPSNPSANTAHDLWAMNFDGSGAPMRLTKPGPISIIPNLKGNSVVYTEISEQENYIGASIVSLDATDQAPQHVIPGAFAPKWIP